MRVRPCSAALPLLVLVASACGGGGPSPASLSYGLPDPATVTYQQGDTVTIDIDAGGQAMQARVATLATLDASFTRAADGVQVTLTYRDFSGRVSQPMGPPVTGDASGIEGPLVFTLDRRGRAALVSAPELSGTAEQFVQPLPTAHNFFPRLPGRAVSVGESWTDTIRFDGPSGPGDVKGTTVVTYTAAGDTVVDGRSLLRIDVEGTTEQVSTGIIAGMDFSQTVSGDLSGWYLWDTRRGLMAGAYQEADLRGSMEVPAAPFPLDIRARSQTTTRLVSPM